MPFFRDIKALLSGDVLWRSHRVGTPPSTRYEVIVKRNSDGCMVVLKQIHGIGQYSYATLEAEHANKLGQALVSGAGRCRIGTSQ